MNGHAENQRQPCGFGYPAFSTHPYHCYCSIFSSAKYFNRLVSEEVRSERHIYLIWHFISAANYQIGKFSIEKLSDVRSINFDRCGVDLTDIAGSARHYAGSDGKTILLPNSPLN